MAYDINLINKNSDSLFTLDDLSGSDIRTAVALLPRMQGEGAVTMTPDGETTLLKRLKSGFPGEKSYLTLRAPFILPRLGIKFEPRHPQIFDLVELFAFVKPDENPVQTVSAFCRALDIAEPESDEEACFALFQILEALGAYCENLPAFARKKLVARAMIAGKAGWNWAAFILTACGYREGDALPSKYDAFAVWETLSEREKQDRRPRDALPNEAITPEEARGFLKHFLGDRAEKRLSQQEFTGTVAEIFASEDPFETPVILCEAETGTGKTAGYLAPALLWSAMNERPVIISTHTKALQRQILSELRRFLPEARIFDRAVAVRKGRDNYLCLRNYKEYAFGGLASPADLIAGAFIAGYAGETRDGDFTGDPFYARLSEFLPDAAIRSVTDKARDCTRAGCEFYKKCFVEKAEDKSKNAQIIVANHAVLIARAQNDDVDDNATHYIFDEAHHLFETADSALTFELTPFTLSDIRRRIVGASKSRRGLGRRTPGATERLRDALSGLKDDTLIQGAIDLAEKREEAARLLPETGFLDLEDQSNEFAVFFAALKEYAEENIPETANPDYGYEILFKPGAALPDTLCQAAKDISVTFQAIIAAGKELVDYLLEASKGADLQPGFKKRMVALARSTERGAHDMLFDCLTTAQFLAEGHKVNDAEQLNYLHILAVSSAYGGETRLSLTRRFVNPAPALARLLLDKAEGVAFASATLRAGNEDESFAKMRTGAAYLHRPAYFKHFASPFDYAQNARIFILNDIRRGDDNALSEAILKLTVAAGGGTLALFTAVRRLLKCRARLFPVLSELGYPLLSQHADGGDNAVLVDVFRETPNALLLGTDALRDGTDVPGDGLRLVIADKVPWPRPDHAHIARREIFGGREYDKTLVRARLKQAFGRLIRKSDDKGCFVLAEKECPSELLNAFPENAPIIRCDTDMAAKAVRGFLRGAAIA